MSRDSITGVARGAVSFFFGTGISRVTGLVRDMSMAFCFGSHPAIAAFMVAYRVANVFRRLLGEGPVASGLIPYFEELRAKDPKEGALFFRDIFFSVACILLAGITGAMVFFPVGHSIIVEEMVRMLPGIGCICLYGIASALLQCERRFFLSSVAPVFFNLVWIGAAWMLYGVAIEQAVHWLSWAVVGGFFVQFLVVMFPLIGYWNKYLSWQELWRFSFFPKMLRQKMRPALLGILGVAAVQLNSALDGFFARYVSLEGPAYLWYAIRIEQLPLSLWGIALSSALLPTLSRVQARGDLEEYRRLLSFSCVRSAGFLFPCAVALFVLAHSGIDLLYGRGEFLEASVVETTKCLWGYGWGLIPSVLVLLWAPAFYANKNYKTPFVATLVSVLVNITGNFLFSFYGTLGTSGIALATSIASLVNCLWLGYALRSFLVFSKEQWLGFGKTLVASLGSGAITLGALLYPMESKLGTFIYLASVFLGSFFLLGSFLRIEEIRWMKKVIKKAALFTQVPLSKED